MTLEEWAALLLAGGIGALGKTLIDGFKTRSDARRDDRRQKMDESKTTADSSRTLIESAEKIVNIQNEQIDDLKRIKVQMLPEEEAAYRKDYDAYRQYLSDHNIILRTPRDFERLVQPRVMHFAANV